MNEFANQLVRLHLSLEKANHRQILLPSPTSPLSRFLSLSALFFFEKFDPPGRFIAAAGNSGLTEIWDLKMRAPIWCGHVKAITSIDYTVMIYYCRKTFNLYSLVQLVSKFTIRCFQRLECPQVGFGFYMRSTLATCCCKVWCPCCFGFISSKK